MNWIDYRIRLGIGFSDIDKFNMLKNTVLNFLECMYDSNYGDESCTEYIFVTYERIDDIYNLKYTFRTSFESTSSLADLIYKYIIFYNTYSPKDLKYSEKFKQNILEFLKRELTFLKIQYELIEDEDGIFIFPKGVPEFDDSLVSQPLEWLKGYPNAENAWSKALRGYAEATNDNASDIADKFRKALEAFFQEFFGGGRSLENYKAEYGGYLKQRNIPKEISGNFETVLQAYTNYMNNYAKHRDGTSDKVLEYIMYQTGNIIRFLITLKQEETANAD